VFDLETAGEPGFLEPLPQKSMVCGSEEACHLCFYLTFNGDPIVRISAASTSGRKSHAETGPATASTRPRVARLDISPGDFFVPIRSAYNMGMSNPFEDHGHRLHLNEYHAQTDGVGDLDNLDDEDVDEEDEEGAEDDEEIVGPDGERG
jgi:hypothetical protein